MYHILLIGDSLTDCNENGWVGQMKQLYQGKAIVYNKGRAGYTSKMIYDIFPSIIENITCPFFCTIFLGTNDCYSPNQLSPDSYKYYLLSIINELRKLNQFCVILLITPPISTFSDKIFEFVDKLHEIVNECPLVELIDMHSGTNKITKNDLYDPVHFGESGNEKVFENIKNCLYSKYSILCPENL